MCSLHGPYDIKGELEFTIALVIEIIAHTAYGNRISIDIPWFIGDISPRLNGIFRGKGYVLKLHKNNQAILIALVMTDLFL